MSRIALLTALTAPDLGPAAADLHAYLARCGHAPVPPDSRDVDAVLVWADSPLPRQTVDRLLAQAADGIAVLLCGPTFASCPEGVVEAAGVVPGAPMPWHETRVRPGSDGGDVAARLDGDLVVTDRWLTVEKVRDDVEVLLTAMSGLTDHAVMTWRPSTHIGVLTIGNSPSTLANPACRLLLHRWLRHVRGAGDGPAARVGILGYGAIGHEHNEAIQVVPGLELTAVCDRNPLRIDEARTLASDVAAYDDGDALLAADDVDVVIVSTPPSTHAAWALRALRAGKHVVVEKPFCLTTAEADDMLAVADEAGRALTVYQNRRWDRDYLTLKQLLHSGAVGDVFHYESFVGTYGHPCNYWHSDEEVSGGAIYDWGSHYLDWVLDLFPHRVTAVTGAAHKRVWHDVTNADHSRVTVQFEDGLEAEFVHSDLAAAMKPKWYVLGTRGAVVGSWREERVVARNRVGNLHEDPLAAAESPAALALHGPDGSVTQVANVPAPAQPFHRELAELLLSGAPMSVTPQGSRRNIAVMEAATTSAREGGRPVQPL